MSTFKSFLIRDQPNGSKQSNSKNNSAIPRIRNRSTDPPHMLPYFRIQVVVALIHCQKLQADFPLKDFRVHSSNRDFHHPILLPHHHHHLEPHKDTPYPDPLTVFLPLDPALLLHTDGVNLRNASSTTMRKKTRKTWRTMPITRVRACSKLQKNNW